MNRRWPDWGNVSRNFSLGQGNASNEHIPPFFSIHFFMELPVYYTQALNFSTAIVVGKFIDAYLLSRSSTLPFLMISDQQDFYFYLKGIYPFQNFIQSKIVIKSLIEKFYFLISSLKDVITRNYPSSFRFFLKRKPNFLIDSKKDTLICKKSKSQKEDKRHEYIIIPCFATRIVIP